MGRADAPAMNPSLPSSPPPAAIAAFLRGVDRRGRLLALVQTGDSSAAQTALVVAAKVFATEAAQWPISQWPMQYWRLLLSIPAMGQRRTDGDRIDVLPAIASLSPPQRASVLLHLVAGLEDADAATALGLGVEAYQQRISSSLPRDAQGELDLTVWRGWRDAAQQALERLPEAVEAVQSPPRPMVTEIPPDVVAATPARKPAATDAAPPHRRARWPWRVLLVVVAAVVAVAAALLMHPRGRAVLDVWRGRIHSEPLPAAAPPKARFDPHDPAFDPDHALHAAPAELALAHRLPQLAWLAASGAPLMAEPAPDTIATAQITANHPVLAIPEQRTSDRVAWAEWQALPANERDALRMIAARQDALPAARQRALAAAYAAQSFDARRGWHLGSTLGQSWPRIAALFTFVPADERQPLLALLRAAAPDEIDALARLAQTTPPQARDGLRRDLLAQPPDQRDAWLQARLVR